MNIRNLSIIASMLFALTAIDPVWAEEDTVLPAGSSEMTQEEYAAYRARIREQLDAAQQAEDKNDEATMTNRRNTNGYGQGYRARQERARSGGGMGGGRGR